MSERSHTPKGQAARARILGAAEPLISARGFHGTSMRDVAEASGLPLATVVYHFAKKEALHGAVLGAIAHELLEAISDGQKQGEAGAPASGAMRALIRWSLRRPSRVRLLLRELLDNPARVSRATTLPLAPVLTALAASVGRAGHPRPELAVLHVVGAVSYVVAARPTVRRIVGAERDRQLMASYEDEAVAFASTVLAIGATETEGPRRAATKSAQRKEMHHDSRATDPARPARPRPRRGKDDGHDGRGRGAGRQRLRG